MPYEILDEITPQANPSHPTNAPGQESIPGAVLRNATSGLVKGAGALESLYNLPDTLARAVITPAASYVYEKITGNKAPFAEMQQKAYEFGYDKPVIEQAAEAVLPKNYLQPRGEGEKFWQNVAQDAALILNPSLGGLTLKQGVNKVFSNLGGAIGRSALGNAAKWGTEVLTDSPLLGEGVKLGTMVLANMYGTRQNLERIKDSSYQQAIRNLSPEAKIDAVHEVGQIDKILSKFKGDHPDKSFIEDRLKSLKKLVPEKVKATTTPSTLVNEAGQAYKIRIPGKRGGSIPVQELVNLKQGWNRYLEDPKLSTDAKAALQRGVGILNTALKRYGMKNPEFYNNYALGDELTKALRGGSKIQEFLESSPLLEKAVKNPLAKTLLGAGLIKGATAVSAPQLAAVGGGLLAAREGSRALKLIMESPAARKYYKDTLEAALRNDHKLALKSLKLLDTTAEKFSKKSNEPIRGRYLILD